MAARDGDRFIQKMMETSRWHAASNAGDIARLLDEMQKIEQRRSEAEQILPDLKAQHSKDMGCQDEMEDSDSQETNCGADGKCSNTGNSCAKKKKETPEKVRSSRHLRQQHEDLLERMEVSKKSEILSEKLLALRNKRYELMQALAQSRGHEATDASNKEGLLVRSDASANSRTDEPPSARASPDKYGPTREASVAHDEVNHSFRSLKFEGNLPYINQASPLKALPTPFLGEAETFPCSDCTAEDRFHLMRPEDFINGRLGEGLSIEPSRTWNSVRGCLQSLEQAMESLASIHGGELVEESEDSKETSTSDDEFDTSNASTMCTESARGSASLGPGALNSCIRSWTPRSSYEASTFDVEWDMSGGADHRILDDVGESADDEDEDGEEYLESIDDNIDRPKSFLCSAAIVTSSGDAFDSGSDSEISSSEVEWEESAVEEAEPDKIVPDDLCDNARSVLARTFHSGAFKTIDVSSNKQQSLESDSDCQAQGCLRHFPINTNDPGTREQIRADRQADAFFAMCDLIDNLRRDVEVLTHLVQTQKNDNKASLTEASLSILEHDMQKHSNAICNLSNSISDDAARPGTPASFICTESAAIFDSAKEKSTDEASLLLEQHTRPQESEFQQQSQLRHNFAISLEYNVEISWEEAFNTADISATDPLKGGLLALNSRRHLIDVQPQVLHAHHTGNIKYETGDRMHKAVDGDQYMTCPCLPPNKTVFELKERDFVDTLKDIRIRLANSLKQKSQTAENIEIEKRIAFIESKMEAMDTIMPDIPSQPEEGSSLAVGESSSQIPTSMVSIQRRRFCDPDRRIELARKLDAEVQKGSCDLDDEIPESLEDSVECKKDDQVSEANFRASQSISSDKILMILGEIQKVREDLDLEMQETLEERTMMSTEETRSIHQDDCLQVADITGVNVQHQLAAEAIEISTLEQMRPSCSDEEGRNVERSERECQTEWKGGMCIRRDESSLEEQSRFWVMSRISGFLEEVELLRKGFDNLMNDMSFDGQQEAKMNQLLLNTKKMFGDVSNIEKHLITLMVNQNELREKMGEANSCLLDAGSKIQKDSKTISQIADMEERLLTFHADIEKHLRESRDEEKTKWKEVHSKLEKTMQLAHDATDSMTRCLKELANIKEANSKMGETAVDRNTFEPCELRMTGTVELKSHALQLESEESSKLIDYLRLKSRVRSGGTADEVELDLSSFPLGPGA
eukprot:764203-Hanusia_phi.AAC.1